jgi:hypothetical protein
MMYDIFHSAMFSDLDDISYAGLVIESMLGWLLAHWCFSAREGTFLENLESPVVVPSTSSS